MTYEELLVLLRNACADQGVTRADVAEVLGVHPNTAGYYLRGMRRMPWDVVQQLCDHLSLRVAVVPAVGIELPAGLDESKVAALRELVELAPHLDQVALGALLAAARTFRPSSGESELA